MKDQINVRWVGIRKTSGNTAFWGWFVLKDMPEIPLSDYWRDAMDHPERTCFVFRGKIREQLIIEPRELTHEFLQEVGLKKKNFKDEDPEKLMSKWGIPLDKELSMFLTMEKLRR